MASSTECPLFPKPRKGAGKTAAENRKRNETNKISQVIPGLSFAQVLNPNKSQQMATRGNASSASNQNIEPNQTNNNDKNKNSVEGTLITITPIDYDPILVGSIYIPPINNYFRNLGAALDTIFNFNNKTILVGDFNAKHTSWGCHCSDTRGNRLYNYIVKNSIDVLAPPTPTRFGLNSASIIDYALIKNLNWPCNISSIPELSSDHNPIKLHFPRTSKFELPPPQLNTTWSKFTLNLANTENLYLHKASSTSEIENEVRELTSEILTAHGNASKPVTHSEVPFVQGELKHLFKERNRARKIWQFTRHPQDKTTLNRLQNTIKRKVNLYRQQVWEEHLTSLDTEDGSLWGTAKAFRRKAAPISALNGPTGTTLSDTHKTELIAQSLESQFQLNDIQNPHKDEYITNTVDAYFTANSNNTEQIPPALPSEILPECLEDCSGGPDSQTWERSHASGIPPTYFLTPYPNANWRKKSFPPD
ncbi:probable RNA-directed DNA polymerase from transposon X-element [Trichonephila clavipes]|nr:probable RNA-directed DNA polymerase from transposon X-element [Trichonephila clavipes]